MNEAYSYRGHSIDLKFQTSKAGGVRCTYFIDADYCFQAEANGVAVDAVRVQAIAQAHTSIDALDSMTSTARVSSMPKKAIGPSHLRPERITTSA